MIDGKCGISAKIICDSVSEAGIRLTTFEIEYPRIILAEVNTHRMLCLSGETVLQFDLPASTNKGQTKVHKMRLKEFVDKWHKGAAAHVVGSKKHFDTALLEDSKVYSAKEIASIVGMGSPSNIRLACRNGAILTTNKDKGRGEDHYILGSDFKTWYRGTGKRSFSLRDRLKRMKIRQINEDTMLIQHTTVSDCFYSGVKELFKVSAGDFSVTGSKDHKILTVSGWKTIEQLSVGTDSLIVQKLGTFDEGKLDPIRLKKIGNKWTCVFNRNIRESVYNSQFGKCNHCGDDLKDSWDIHHKIPVLDMPELAFSLENVVGVHKHCHKELHEVQGWQQPMYLHGASVLVDSVVCVGEQETYDLSMSGQFENFLANGVVVHNSKNSSSSRAIPFEKMSQQLTGRPVRFGSNKAGMQDGGEHKTLVWHPCATDTAEGAWLRAKGDALEWAVAFKDAGYHKQVYNRLTEPFQMMKTVISGTDWQNFFWLRCDEAADPTIAELANCMKEAYEKSEPTLLKAGWYHLPYVDSLPDQYENGRPMFYIADEQGSPQWLTTGDAIKVSCARCCAVSFRNVDYGLEKCLEVYEKLVNMGKLHGSALEHCATPMNEVQSCNPSLWQEGISHSDREGNLWSGNFKGFIQYRKTITGECYKG